MDIEKRYSELITSEYDYDEALKVLQKECIDKKLYSKFVNYLLNRYHVHDEYAESFLDVLVEQREYHLFKIYWKTRLSEQIRYFWELVDYYKNDKDKRFTTKDFLSYDREVLNENHEKYPAMQDAWLEFVWYWHDTLDFIDRYIAEMQKINATEEIERAKALKESVYNLKKPKAKKTTDKRKMSEELFWMLIAESRNERDSDSEFIDALKDKLESMGAPEIKKFQKYFLEKMNELYDWDIWALAYIVRKGCGDDAFDYFCAWVISKGKEVFAAVKYMQKDKLKDLFDEDPQLEEMMYVAQEAYENKKNEMMPDIKVKSQKIQGVEWKEETICNSYPELCKIFGY